VVLAVVGIWITTAGRDKLDRNQLVLAWDKVPGKINHFSVTPRNSGMRLERIRLKFPNEIRAGWTKQRIVERQGESYDFGTAMEELSSHLGTLRSKNSETEKSYKMSKDPVPFVVEARFEIDGDKVEVSSRYTAFVSGILGKSDPSLIVEAVFYGSTFDEDADDADVEAALEEKWISLTENLRTSQ